MSFKPSKLMLKLRFLEFSLETRIKVIDEIFMHSVLSYIKNDWDIFFLEVDKLNKWDELEIAMEGYIFEVW